MKDEAIRKFFFWQKWLEVVFLLLIAMGIAMAVLFLALPTKPLNDPVIRTFWPDGGLSAGTSAFHSWAFGVWGATLAGWALSMVFVVRHAFRQQERWSWAAMVASISLWYPIDTYVSIHFGVYFNAVLNTVILLAVVIPLLVTRRYFR